jgi:hypothetical protein
MASVSGSYVVVSSYLGPPVGIGGDHYHVGTIRACPLSGLKGEISGVEERRIFGSS